MGPLMELNLGVKLPKNEAAVKGTSAMATTAKLMLSALSVIRKSDDK